MSHVECRRVVSAVLRTRAITAKYIANQNFYKMKHIDRRITDTDARLTEECVGSTPITPSPAPFLGAAIRCMRPRTHDRRFVIRKGRERCAGTDGRTLPQFTPGHSLED